jgi:hypothetical protein
MAPRPSGLVSRYRQDHRHPVNHFLHVGVGWPMVAIAVLLLPFRPAWSLVLVLLAYAIMFFGHFAFERNLPTILRHPSTPFVVAGSVIRELWGGLVRLVKPRRRSPATGRPRPLSPVDAGPGRR